jgi:type III pantothenate kinase
LHARAAQLPASGGEYRDFADNTLDALRSGCDGAALALIDKAQSDAENTLGIAPSVFLHGGGADALFAAGGARPLRSQGRAEIEPSLVLHGLAAYIRALDDAADTMPAC